MTGILWVLEFRLNSRSNRIWCSRRNLDRSSWCRLGCSSPAHTPLPVCSRCCRNSRRSCSTQLFCGRACFDLLAVPVEACHGCHSPVLKQHSKKELQQQRKAYLQSSSVSPHLWVEKELTDIVLFDNIIKTQNGQVFLVYVLRIG